MSTVQTNDKVLLAIAAAKDCNKYYFLVDNEPSIDWHKFASELYQVSDSVNTITSYCKAICKFKDMIAPKTITKVIEEIKADKNGLVYQYLAGFVTFCSVNKGYSPAHTRANLAAVKRLFIFLDVDIDLQKLRYKVKLPKKRKINDPYPTNEEIKLILNAASPHVRTFLQVMLDTGLEPTDLTQLKPKHFKFEQEPVGVSTIREKTGEQIETFVSRDTAEAVKALIALKNKGTNDYIFTVKFDYRAIQRMRDGYNLALARAGFGKVVRNKKGGYQGKPIKIDGHRFGKWHFKVYKKRWFTLVGSSGVPEHVSQGMLGRHAYLDEYFKLTADKRLEFGKKILKIVSVYGDKIDKQEVIDKAAEILGIDASMLDETKLRAIRGLVPAFAVLPTDKINAITKLLGKSGEGEKNA